jgi:transcriptional regulator with XRE-family HTH domain
MSIPLCIMEWEDRDSGKQGGMPSRLALFIEEELARRGMDQIDLSAAAELPNSTLNRILQSVKEPRPTQIARIAKGFQMPFWRLMQIAGYTTEDPDDPDEENQRLAETIKARPALREILREAESLTAEEQDAVLTYIVVTRQRRPPQDRQSPESAE